MERMLVESKCDELCRAFGRVTSPVVLAGMPRHERGLLHAGSLSGGRPAGKSSAALQPNSRSSPIARIHTIQRVVAFSLFKQML